MVAIAGAGVKASNPRRAVTQSRATIDSSQSGIEAPRLGVAQRSSLECLSAGSRSRRRLPFLGHKPSHASPCARFPGVFSAWGEPPSWLPMPLFPPEKTTECP